MLVDVRDLHEIREVLGNAAVAARGGDVTTAENEIGRADYLVYEIMGGRGRKPLPVHSGGNCGWCHDPIETDIFKHVQFCRRDFDHRQAIQMRAAAKSLTKLAKDLETK
jgi:hypothetical protein